MSRERNLLWALQKQEEEEIEGLTTGLIRFSRKGKREREKNFCVSKSEDRVRREETNYLARADGRADDRPLLPGNEIKRNKPDLASSSSSPVQRSLVRACYKKSYNDVVVPPLSGA